MTSNYNRLPSNSLGPQAPSPAENSLPGERPDKRAAFVVQRPRSVQVVAAILVGHGDGGHGMRRGSQRRIKSVFIPAQVVLLADGAGLNRNHIAGLQAGTRAVL